MKKPNIVIILADDTGYGDVSCYNPNSLIPTPAIDRLAKEGLRFTDAHSPSALCTPTRYGIITGRYHWRTPQRHSLVMPYDPPIIELDRPTLPKMLQSAGYATACVGKWHLGLNYPTAIGGYTQHEPDIDFAKSIDHGPNELGFDYFFGTAGCSTSDPPYCFIEQDKTVGIPTVHSTEPMHSLPGFFPGLMAEDWIEEEVDVELVKQAKSFVDRHLSEQPDNPFFLYLPISAPHNPWLPPAFTQGKSTEGPRGDMNVLVDWCVGEMYEALSDRGILDDTLLIFTSDNGPMRGENGQQSAGYLRGYKNMAFEGGHRIPFVARWPEVIAADTVADDLICLTDFFASFATHFELPLGTDEAEDSLPTMGKVFGVKPQQPRPHMVNDTGGHSAKVGDFAIRAGEWKLVVIAPPDKDNYARKKPIPEDAVQGRLLFNLRADPAEEHNLVEERPDVAEALDKLLSELKRKGSKSVDAPLIAEGK